MTVENTVADVEKLHFTSRNFEWTKITSILGLNLSIQYTPKVIAWELQVLADHFFDADWDCLATNDVVAEIPVFISVAGHLEDLLTQMRVLSQNQAWVLQIIGENAIASCPSLPKSLRIKSDWN